MIARQRQVFVPSGQFDWRVSSRSGHHFRCSFLSFGEQNEGSGVLVFVIAGLEFVIMMRESGSCQLAR